MNNVHEDAPVVFESRWALSYLRGPLTREQIRRLMKDAGDTQDAGSAKPRAAADVTSAPTAARPVASMLSGARPVLGADIAQLFLPVRSDPPDNRAKLVYHPTLMGAGKVYFTDTKTGVDQEEEISLITPITDNVVAVDWSQAEEADVTENDLDKDPAANASFVDLPAATGKAKNYDAWKKAFVDSLLRGRQLQLFRCGSLKETSKPGESERDFRVRLQQVSREQRDAAVEKLRQKYAPKMITLQDRIRRAQQAVEREQEQANASKWQTAISVGSTLLGAFLGRKALSAGTIGRATTAARGASRAYKESQDVSRAGENVEALQQQLNDLQAQFDAESAQIAQQCDPQTEELETITLKPKKTNITVRSLVLAWAPYWQAGGNETSAWS
jgi:hypothetical protein